MGDVGSLELKVLDAVADVPERDWDRLFQHERDRATPFVRHAFLSAVEESGCARARTGWRPRHLTLWRGQRLVAAVPAYQRDRSDGDFGRDWEWAGAVRNAGLSYY